MTSLEKVLIVAFVISLCVTAIAYLEGW